MMDEDILLRCSNLKITAEEDDIVVFDDVTDGNINPSIELSIVGRVMTERPFNFDAFKRTMNQIWTISKGALFRRIENGLFVVQFATARDRAKVLDGRPWTFDQHLVMLNEIVGGVQPSDMALLHCPFWIRLYNLPLDCRSVNHVRRIGGSLGEVVEVETDGVMWDNSVRIKVMIDVSKPLKRVQRIRSSTGVGLLIEIKYERLPIFCYACGIIGHIERDCVLVPDDDREEEKQWGAWLKASPRRGYMKKQAETKLFLSCARALEFRSPKPTGLEDKSDQGEAPHQGGNMNIVSPLSCTEGELQPAVLDRELHLEAGSKKGDGVQDTGGVSDPPDMSGAARFVLNEKESEGAQEYAREPGGCVQEFAREDGGISINDVDVLVSQADSRAVMTTHEQGMFVIPTFVMGCDSVGVKNKKKISRKMVVGNKPKQNILDRGASRGKRKGGSDVGSGMDGEDVDMDGVGITEKRLKVTDNDEGADELLTVAEVGIVQPREGQ